MSGSRDTKLLGWLGWAGADAIGRLVLLTGSTAIFSRLLDPADFGVAALVLAIVMALSLCVGAPFEEALAQRRVLRRAHIQAALAVSWAVAIMLILVSAAAAPFIATAYGEPGMALLLPVAALSILFSGHGDLATAMARRRKQFNEVARANLVSHVIGVPLAVALALAGAGVWALIAMRLFVVMIRSLMLQTRIGLPLMPRWSRRHLADIARFAGISFFDRVAENLTYLAFNAVAGAIYGVTVLGYINMAMRLIEPIRGAVIAASHNLAFGYFTRASRNPQGIGDQVRTTVTQAAFVVMPVFLGLAAVTPVLLPLVAGPGWDAAIDTTICLAAGAALFLPVRLIGTALSATGRPEISLASTLLGLCVTLAAMFAAAPLGPVSVGLARLLGDAAQAALLLAIPARQLGWPPLARLKVMVAPLLIAAAMGAAVWGVMPGFRVAGPLASLALGIVSGMAIQVALMAVFARPALTRVFEVIRPGAVAHPAAQT